MPSEHGSEPLHRTFANFLLANFSKRRPEPLVRTRSSSSSSDSSFKQPRTPRFAEATSVNSPIDKVSPFADPPLQGRTNSYMAQSQPSDIGFGYISHSDEHIEVPMTPASPLKSAMRVPGAAPRTIENPLSPTFREEQVLEKNEAVNEKQQAKDLVRRRTDRIAIARTNNLAESQDQSPRGKVPAPRRQLQLQSYHSCDDFHDHDHLPRHQ